MESPFPVPDESAPSPRAEHETSQWRLDMVVGNAPIVLWSIDAEGCITLSTGRGLEGLGLEDGEVVGRSVYELYGDIPQVVRGIQRALGGEKVTEVVEVRGTFFQSVIQPLKDVDGTVTGAIGVATDVTEQEQAKHALADHEQARQESQRLEALGRLAGGVAHEFSNQLTVIAGFARLLERELEREHPARPDLEQIRSAADHATRLVREMLAFARRAPHKPRRHRIDAIVEQSVALLRPLLDERVVTELDLRAGGSWVHVDDSWIEQVLLNLALNARDAMPTGGTLRFATRTTELGGEDARSRGLSQGPHVRLVVADSGSGMTEEVRARAFEPFFTTKGVGAGTGLGLATCHGLVGRAGGHIGVESREGRGTTFTILLPTCAPGTLDDEVESPAVPTGGGESVLLVEDDATVRGFASRVLRDRGYHVTEAADGREALARARADAVDLVITDVVMPGLDGHELADRLRRDRPDLPFVLVSGHVGEVADGVGPNATFLAKPYGPEELADSVRRALDGRL